MLLRVVLQDTLSEVTKFYLEVEGFCGRHHSAIEVKNKVVAEMAKKVMKKWKEEVERKELKLSVYEDGKEGKSKMIASCGFLDNELRQFSKEEGVTVADSVDTLGVDLRTRVKKLGAKEKARRKKIMEAYGLEVEEELHTLATQYWAEGVWVGKWHHEQRSVDEANSRSSDVEASERTSRGSDV